MYAECAAYVLAQGEHAAIEAVIRCLKYRDEDEDGWCDDVNKFDIEAELVEFESEIGAYGDDVSEAEMPEAMEVATLRP